MTIDPIVKKISVKLAPAAAFELFTAKLNDWWPVDSHSVSSGQGAVSKSLILTAGVGGELVEIGHDDARHVWGQVEEWEPGAALALTWHPGTSPNNPTRVRVTFDADGDGTLVTLTHSGWETLGDEGAKMRGGYNEGWVGVLAQYSKSA